VETVCCARLRQLLTLGGAGWRGALTMHQTTDLTLIKPFYNSHIFKTASLFCLNVAFEDKLSLNIKPLPK